MYGNILHAERSKEFPVTEEKRHEQEDYSGIDDAHGHHFADMSELAVPYFMGQHGYDFIGGKIVDQGIEKGDTLLFAESGKECIGFGGTLGTVNHENAGKFKSVFSCELFDFFFQFAIFKRGEFVEQGQNPCGGNVLHTKGDQHGKKPTPEPCKRSGSIEEKENATENCSADDTANQIAFKFIHEKSFEGCFVEPEFFFNDKSAVEGKWQGYKVAEYR